MEMEKAEIEQMFQDVLGFVTCPHNVYLPENHCEECAQKVAKENIELTDNFIKNLSL
jgi:hypothetical protein